LRQNIIEFEFILTLKSIKECVSLRLAQEWHTLMMGLVVSFSARMGPKLCLEQAFEWKILKALTAIVVHPNRDILGKNGISMDSEDQML